MTETKKWVGIDVSGSELVVGVYPSAEISSFSNEQLGVDKLIKFVKVIAPALIVLEATGGIETLVATELYNAGMPVRIVNPRQVRDFAKSLGMLAKTDAIDAVVIARYGEAVKPQARPMASEEEIALKELTARRRQLIDMLVQEKNRYSRAGKNIKPEIEKHIKWLEKRLKDMDTDLSEAVKNSPRCAEKENILRSVPGVGRVLSATLLADMPELGSLNRREIAALAGVAPFNRDSGMFRGHRTVWGGRGKVRRMLYMGVISAIRSNSVIKAFYQRLIGNGKKPKVALTACMRKLLVILNAMIKHKQVWSISVA